MVRLLKIGLPLLAATWLNVTQAGNLLVFAAASLTDAIGDVAGEFERSTGLGVTAAFAGSSTLARQIEAGAPADVFLSANVDWMDYLQQHDLIDAASRFDLLGNRLVLIAPSDSGIRTSIAPGFPLAGLLGDGYLAMANTEAVPAGRYGKSALQSLGVWDSVAGRIAQAEDVRAALALVSRGEAPLGVVYATDAAIDPGVRVVDTFPADSHEPIHYPVAALTASEHPQSRAFLVFLRSPSATAVFERYGFTVLGRP